MSEADDAKDVPAGPTGKPSLKQRLSDLFSQYGSLAIYTYFALSIATIIGFSIAIGIGAEPSSATGVLGVIAAGWVAAKATLPIRILITLGLTPVVAIVIGRFGRRAAGPPAEEPHAPDATLPAADAAPPGTQPPASPAAEGAPTGAEPPASPASPAQGDGS